MLRPFSKVPAAKLASDDEALCRQLVTTIQLTQIALRTRYDRIFVSGLVKRQSPISIASHRRVSWQIHASTATDESNGAKYTHAC